MKVIKFLFLIIAVMYTLLGYGFFQQVRENRATARCEKKSSAKYYWHHVCPTGERYYTLKTDEEVAKYLKGEY